MPIGPLRVDGALDRVRWAFAGPVRRAGAGVLLASRRPTARLRALPDFVVVGAQKAGTSTLYSRLVAHPAVIPAFRKEVHYFDRSRRSPDWYRAHFPLESTRRRLARRDAAGGRALTGEATPYYLAHPAVPVRMQALMPDVRVLVVLRDPVERAVSAYHHAVRWGFEDRPIEVALDPGAEEALADPADDAWYDAPDCPLRRRGYLARGRYVEQLRRWHAVFAPEQLLVLETADLRSGRAVDRACSFLGLTPASFTGADRNVRDRPAAPDRLSAVLRDHFAPHDDQLWDLLGRRLAWADADSSV